MKVSAPVSSIWSTRQWIHGPVNGSSSTRPENERHHGTDQKGRVSTGPGKFIEATGLSVAPIPVNQVLTTNSK